MVEGGALIPADISVPNKATAPKGRAQSAIQSIAIRGHAARIAIAAKRLDGSVKFYLAGNKPAGNVAVVKSGVTTSQKTNAFNKSDEEACSWALQSALIRMQNAAKQAGANAVVNIVSNYKNVVYSDAQKYECHAGAIMAGVALKADLANVK